MAESRNDARLAARYRALATEEPSVVLDDAIRAAARRAVSSSPRRRASTWTIPASIAAVLVLSFGITLRMQEEQPGIETYAPVARAPEAAKPEPARSEPAKQPEAPKEVPAEPKEKKRFASPPVAPQPKPDAAMQRAPAAVTAPFAESPRPTAPAPRPAAPPASAVVQPPAFVPSPAPASAPSPPPVPAPRADPLRDSKAAATPAPAMESNLAAGRRDEAAGSVGGLTAKRAKAEETEARATAKPFQAPAGAAAESPERQLERIVELRRAGRDREADEALAKFRREHPDYVIKPELWEQVRAR